MIEPKRPELNCLGTVIVGVGFWVIVVTLVTALGFALA